jgi:hypothetical protein
LPEGILMFLHGIAKAKAWLPLGQPRRLKGRKSLFLCGVFAFIKDELA